MQWRRQDKEQLVQSDREGRNSTGNHEERKQRVLVSVGKIYEEAEQGLKRGSEQQEDSAIHTKHHVQRCSFS